MTLPGQSLIQPMPRIVVSTIGNRVPDTATPNFQLLLTNQTTETTQEFARILIRERDCCRSGPPGPCNAAVPQRFKKALPCYLHLRSSGPSPYLHSGPGAFEVFWFDYPTHKKRKFPPSHHNHAHTFADRNLVFSSPYRPGKLRTGRNSQALPAMPSRLAVALE